mmetsp:Transcript_76316/g.196500  ORF Transcript_76316/g.196500 Transcript_76316/m.196500 type:complete len:232 (+) Transcript_76316:838-1533(+)
MYAVRRIMDMPLTFPRKLMTCFILGQSVLTKIPVVIAVRTTARLSISDLHGMSTTSPNRRWTYTIKFTGSIAEQNKVDTAVMATESARSALKREHHQFEYAPPGLLTRIIKVSPMCCGGWSALMMVNPMKGMRMNWQNRPHVMPLPLRNWPRSAEISTEPDRPMTRKKSTTMAATPMKKSPSCSHFSSTSGDALASEIFLSACQMARISFSSETLAITALAPPSLGDCSYY